MDAHFVVEVGPGTIARHAHSSDDLAFSYRVAGFDGKIFEVAEHGRISVAVLDAD